MRVFSQFEQHLMTRMVEIGFQLELPAIHNYMNGLWGFHTEFYVEGRPAGYDLKVGENHYHKIITKKRNNDFPADYLVFLRKARDLKEIITYLLENGYCIQRKSSLFFGIKIKDGIIDSNQVDTEDEDLYLYEDFKYLLHILEFNIFPTETLKHLVNDSFRTKQDLYNEETRRISKTSTYVAIASVLITIILGTINYRKSSDAKQVLEIDSTTIDMIIDRASRIKEPVIIRDTVYIPAVKVSKPGRRLLHD